MKVTPLTVVSAALVAWAAIIGLAILALHNPATAFLLGMTGVVLYVAVAPKGRVRR